MSTADESNLEKFPLRDKVFTQLRDDILSGKYQVNEELKEVAIGKTMGVSRTPVREALRQLELEGLVNIIPNKGAYVRGITQADIHDIFVIRTYLEGLCAKWCCRHASQDELDKLDEIICLAEFNATRNKYEQMAELDSKFHETLYNACGSKMLRHILIDFHQYVESVRKQTLSRSERACAAIEEHKAILVAIKNRDENLAEKLSSEHIITTMENLRKRGLLD
ncbi:MAG: GntR family transcriptional regulator [Lachnospiraceae bacterium]